MILQKDPRYSLEEPGPLSPRIKPRSNTKANAYQPSSSTDQLPHGPTMSVLVLGDADLASTVSISEVKAVAQAYNLTIPPSEPQDCATLFTGVNVCDKQVLEIPDHYPEVDLNLYPRRNIRRPTGDKETDFGGWATKATITCAAPKSYELSGKTFAIKDAIAVAGSGLAAKVGEWVPQFDATVVTRILDASGTILGKSVCEAGCLIAVSDTSVTSNVHNPYAYGYSTGGSSSGSAKLIATGQVDMAIKGGV
jgi:amidase